MTAEILPLFSLPVYKIKDSDYRASPELLDKLLSSIPLGFAVTQLSAETNILDRADMTDARKLCEFHIAEYARTVMGCSNEFYITNSWLAHSKHGDIHPAHVHKNTIIAGCLYLQAEDNQPIKFHSKAFQEQAYPFDYTITEYNIFNNPNPRIDVHTGTLLLWPGWLNHSVDPHLGEKPRLVLGFNAFVRGQIGGTASSDYGVGLTL
jgi:hypothetical protein